MFRYTIYFRNSHNPVSMIADSWELKDNYYIFKLSGKDVMHVHWDYAKSIRREKI